MFTIYLDFSIVCGGRGGGIIGGGIEKLSLGLSMSAVEGKDVCDLLGGTTIQST